jgi:ribonucleotide monophosphatase NagD (HAD superfamily)
LRQQGVLLDQYGVLHDGRQAYPGAVAAVEALAASGRKLLIISNSSRRAPA